MRHFGYRDWTEGIAKYERWRRNRKRWWLMGGLALIMAGAVLWRLLGG